MATDGSTGAAATETDWTAGSNEPIRSRRNPVIRSLRALHEPAGRRRQGRVLLEGTHLLQECLRLHLVPDLVLATPGWIAGNPALVAGLPAPVRLQPAAEEALSFAASTRHPDGVLLALPLSALPAGAGHPPGFVLALDRVQDPGNVGTLLRTALAAGVEEVWLGDGADPLQPKVMRASSGAALALPCVRLDQAALVQRLHQARDRGLQLVAAVAPGPGAAATPYWSIDWRAPTLLMLGNEGQGLGDELLALARHRLTIPHHPAVESLNVAAAAAPLLLERWRQERMAPSRAADPGERCLHGP
jgi:TrmH family RNA methyltransferase